MTQVTAQTLFINAESLARFLGNGKEKGSGAKWQTLCPLHGDKDPSVDVSERDGKIMIYCQACKTSVGLIDYLKPLGMWPIGGVVGGSIWTEKKSSTSKYAPREDYWKDHNLFPMDYYPYENEDGVVLYESVRLWDSSKEKKTFMQYRPREQGGWWAKLHLNFLPTLRMVPFRLRNVLEAAEMGIDIVITEGEKDVVTLEEDGEIASTNVQGQGKWLDTYTPYFRGAGKKFFVPDNDYFGYEHMNQVGASFAKDEQELWIVILPGVKKKGDYTDWREGGDSNEGEPAHSHAEFEALKKTAVLWTPTAFPNPFPNPDKKKKLEAANPVQEEGSNVVKIYQNVKIELKFEAFTDSGNADRLQQLYGNKIRYSKQVGWMVDIGPRWAKDDTGMVAEFAKEVARKIPDERDLAGSETLIKFASKSLNAEKISAMLRSAQTRPGIACRYSDFDKHDHLMNFQNGIVDLRTGELMKHDPLLMLERISPCDYSETDEEPVHFIRTLSMVCQGDETKFQYFLELFGYYFTGYTYEQKAWFHNGEGQNFKSTIFETLVAIMGEGDDDCPGYAKTIRKEMFMKQAGFESHADNFSQLKGVRFATVAETSEKDQLDIAKIKIFTGGDKIPGARFLRHEPFSYNNKAKLAIRCNYMPRLLNFDKGSTRRIARVPWTFQIPDELIDNKVPDLIREELPLIARYIIKNGCVPQLARRKFIVPADYNDSTEEYLQEQNVAQAFFERVFERCTDGEVTSTDMQALWQQYCKEGGHREKSSLNLGIDLKRLGIEQRKSNGVRYYLNIKVRDDYQLKEFKKRPFYAAKEDDDD